MEKERLESEYDDRLEVLREKLEADLQEKRKELEERHAVELEQLRNELKNKYTEVWTSSFFAFYSVIVIHQSVFDTLFPASFHVLCCSVSS